MNFTVARVHRDWREKEGRRGAKVVGCVGRGGWLVWLLLSFRADMPCV